MLTISYLVLLIPSIVIWMFIIDLLCCIMLPESSSDPTFFGRNELSSYGHFLSDYVD